MSVPDGIPMLFGIALWMHLASKRAWEQPLVQAQAIAAQPEGSAAHSQDWAVARGVAENLTGLLVAGCTQNMPPGEARGRWCSKPVSPSTPAQDL